MLQQKPDTNQDNERGNAGSRHEQEREPSRPMAGGGLASGERRSATHLARQVQRSRNRGRFLFAGGRGGLEWQKATGGGSQSACPLNWRPRSFPA